MSNEQKGDKQNEESPTEKLQDAPQTDALTPGVQKPESEVQNEKRMNTE